MSIQLLFIIVLQIMSMNVSVFNFKNTPNTKFEVFVPRKTVKLACGHTWLNVNVLVAYIYLVVDRWRVFDGYYSIVVD